MWPILLALLRRNAVFITLPVAGLVGFIGYNLEDLLSDKYTPYSPSVQEIRAKRLSDGINPATATELEKVENNIPVLERNLSPSLQRKK